MCRKDAKLNSNQRNPISGDAPKSSSKRPREPVIYLLPKERAKSMSPTLRSLGIYTATGPCFAALFSELSTLAGA